MLFKADGLVYGRVWDAADNHIDLEGQQYPIKKSRKFKKWLKIQPPEFFEQKYVFYCVPKTLRKPPYICFYIKYVDTSLQGPIVETFDIIGRVFYQNKSYKYILIKTASYEGKELPMKLDGEIEEQAVGNLYRFGCIRLNNKLIINTYETYILSEEFEDTSGSS